MNVLLNTKSFTAAMSIVLAICIFAMVGQASIKFESGHFTRNTLKTLGLGHLRGFQLAEDTRDNHIHLFWSSDSFRLKWQLDVPSSLGSPQPLVLKFTHGSVYNYLLLQGIVEELVQDVRKGDPTFGLRAKVPRYVGKDDLVGTTDIRLPNTHSGRKFLRKLAKKINKLNDRF